MNGEGESRAPAGRRHAGEPGEETRCTASQRDAEHAVRQADGARLGNLAEIVEECGDEEIGVVFARGAKRLADAAEMGSIVGREEAEGGGLAIR